MKKKLFFIMAMLTTGFGMAWADTVNGVDIDVSAATGDNPVDVTGWVMNPNFDEALDETVWQSENKSWLLINNTWNVCFETKTNPCLDFGPTSDGGRVYQVITGLPNGVYGISANVFSNGDGSSFYGNGQSADITKDAQYQPAKTLNLTISDGTLEFGMSFTGEAWAQMDNITLTYYGASVSESVTAPTISLTAAAAGSRTVSIADGASNLGNAVKTYYSTDGTEPSIEYTAPFAITATTTVKAKTMTTTTSIASDVAEQMFTIGATATTYDVLAGIVSLSSAVQQSDETALTLTAAGAEGTLAMKGTWRFRADALEGIANSDLSILNVKQGDIVVVDTYAEWVAGNMLVEQSDKVSTVQAGNTIVYTVTGADCTQIDFKQRGGNQWIGITSIGIESDAARSKQVNFVDGDANLVLNKAFTVDNASYTRSFTPDQWATLCLPFAVATPSGLTVKALKEATEADGTLTLDFSGASETTIEAGVPYMVKPSTSSVTFSVSGDVAVTNTVKNTEKTNADFIGTLANGTIPANSFYIKGNQFHSTPIEGTASIGAFRAYVTAKSAEVKGISWNIDDETTAIQSVRTETMKNTAIYNLAGQRVVEPQKGIYIVNGKKVLY